MKKLLIIVCLFAMFASLPALADKEAKVREILKLQHVDKQIATILNQQVLIPLECTFVIPESEKNSWKKDLIKALDVSALMDPLIQFWADRYTESELDEIVRFYKTPVGQKSIEVQEKMALFFPQQLEKWLQQVLPNVQKFGEKMEKEYSKRSGNEAQACVQKYQK